MADTHASQIQDKDIYWRRKRKWLPFVPHGFSATSMVGLHTGAPAQTEVSTFGFCGLLFDAEGEEACIYWNLPADVDVAHNIYFRIHYSSKSSTSTDETTWLMFYSACVIDGGIIESATTELDTAIPADVYTAAAAYYLRKTAWGHIDGGTIEPCSFLILRVECHDSDAALASSEEAYLFGVDAEYTPIKTVGPGASRPGASNVG